MTNLCHSDSIVKPDEFYQLERGKIIAVVDLPQGDLHAPMKLRAGKLSEDFCKYTLFMIV